MVLIALAEDRDVLGLDRALFGVGLSLAVLADAFPSRAAPVPGFLRLAGPGQLVVARWLRRWHLR